MSVEQSVPTWDMTISHPLAFLKHEPAVVDYAITIGGGLHGVAFALFTPIAFAARFGVAPQPLLPPGEAIGGTALQIANWNRRTRLYEEQQKHLISLRRLVLATPQDLLDPMKDDHGSLVTRSTEFIYTTLRVELGTLTQEDLDTLMHQLTIKYHVGKSLPSFLANWNATLRDLTRAGQRLPELLATQTLRQCFGPEFDKCWQDFAKDVDVVANRTVARLCAAIILFGRDLLPLITAQTAIGANLVVELQESVKQLQALVATQAVTMQQALAVQRAPLPSRSTRKRGQQQVAALEVPPIKVNIRLIPFANRLFCWNHGPCQHVGDGCDGPPLDERTKYATWRDQRGSKWRELFKSKGWSTVSP